MITILGSLNMDLIIRVPHLVQPGETLHGDDFRTACGGKGANQAYAVARMGGPAALIGSVGDDDFGSAMRANLQAVGVDTQHVEVLTGTPSGVALINVDASAQNTIVVAGGANLTVNAGNVQRATALIQHSQAVITQFETTMAAVETCFTLARSVGAITVLNPAPYAEASDTILALCDYIIPNETEASKLSGIAVTNIASAQVAATALKARGVRNVLVTLGAQGVWIDADTFRGHIPSFPVKAVDTVAAGDTFIGAFVVRLCEGATVADAARFGCAAAAIAVTRMGAQPSIPDRAEVEALVGADLGDIRGQRSEVRKPTVS